MGIYYYENSKRIAGKHSELRGNVSELRGNVSGLSGDASGIRGDVSECGITTDERTRGISIEELVEDNG